MSSGRVAKALLYRRDEAFFLGSSGNRDAGFFGTRMSEQALSKGVATSEKVIKFLVYEV